MNMKKIGFLCCIACLCFACKTAEKAAKEPTANKETEETALLIEKRAAVLACDCIKKLKTFDQDSYSSCVAQGLLKAIDEFGSPDHYKNDYVRFESMKKVYALLPSICGEQLNPKHSTIYEGYGSPNVKHQLKTPSAALR